MDIINIYAKVAAKMSLTSVSSQRLRFLDLKDEMNHK